jgi:hypothetical protein
METITGYSMPMAVLVAQRCIILPSIQGIRTSSFYVFFYEISIIRKCFLI